MKVTMEYIARLANVSKSTVSRVLNNKTDGVGPETRQRVQKILQETGYNIAPSIGGTSKSKIIGLVLPDLTNPFFCQLAKVVADLAEESDYTVMICHTSERPRREDRCIAVLTAARVDGVILATSYDTQQRLSERLKKYQIPCVLMDRHLRQDESTSGVFVDGEYAFFLATQLLIRHGNRRILFLQGNNGLSSSCERLDGYRSALKQYQLPFEKSLVFNGRYSYQGGLDSVRLALAKGISFSAVLAANDMMAFGALRALHEAGIRVPRDMEVMGFDNIDFCSINEPPLSTMEQPVRDLAEQSFQMLLQRIHHPQTPGHWVRLEARLVERATTRSQAIYKEVFL